LGTERQNNSDTKLIDGMAIIYFQWTERGDRFTHDDHAQQLNLPISYTLYVIQSVIVNTKYKTLEPARNKTKGKKEKESKIGNTKGYIASTSSRLQQQGQHTHSLILSAHFFRSKMNFIVIP
jgi:hypothetical protein